MRYTNMQHKLLQEVMEVIGRNKESRWIFKKFTHRGCNMLSEDICDP